MKIIFLSLWLLLTGCSGKDDCDACYDQKYYDNHTYECQECLKKAYADDATISVEEEQ